jgi:hypothetical protein
MGLTTAGAGAIGAAIAGALAGALKWEGGRLTAVMSAGVFLGAGLGFVAAEPSAPPPLSAPGPQVDLLAKMGGDDAKLARVLKTYYPSDWSQVQSILAAKGAGGVQDAEARRALSAVALPLMMRQLQLANTKNVTAYLVMTRDELKVLARKPELCLAMMTEPGPDSTAHMAAAMPDDLNARDQSLAIKVLEQTATHPQPPHPSGNTDQKLALWTRDAVWSLSYNERDALSGADGPRAQGKAYCKALGSLFNTLILDHPRDAAEAYKVLAARGAARMGT